MVSDLSTVNTESCKNIENIFASWKCFLFVCFTCKDEYNLNPGLEWDDEFAGRTYSRSTQIAKQAFFCISHYSSFCRKITFLG
jgi:hypothetical protein